MTPKTPEEKLKHNWNVYLNSRPTPEQLKKNEEARMRRRKLLEDIINEEKRIERMELTPAELQKLEENTKAFAEDIQQYDQDFSDKILQEVAEARRGPEEEAPDGLSIDEQIEWLFADEPEIKEDINEFNVRLKEFNELNNSSCTREDFYYLQNDVCYGMIHGPFAFSVTNGQYVFKGYRLAHNAPNALYRASIRNK
jgi:hypothetical protein